MCVCAGFHVSDASFNYEEAAMYCESKKGTLASIYTTEELAEARAVIRAKGIDKAITSAFADGTGWKWREKTEYWKYEEFPFNTGKVTDQFDPRVEGFVGMYSLHGDGDFIWDADGREEKHPALCRAGVSKGSTGCCYEIRFESTAEEYCFVDSKTIVSQAECREGSQ